MIKKTSKVGLAIMSLIGASTAIAQGTVKNNFEASANIESHCRLQSQDVNFGVVSLPLTTQSANAQMNILCSNATAYKVDLEYGGNYVGQESIGTSGVSGITAIINYKTTDSYEVAYGRKLAGYRLYKDGTPIGAGSPSNLTSDYTYDFNLNGDSNLGDFECSSVQKGQIYFWSLEAAQLVQKTSVKNTWVKDNNNLCDPNAGRINQVSFNKMFVGEAKANKGTMTGTFKGDKLAYQVTLPGDSSKPWIAGVNSYESIGTGSNQTIEVNAKIVPEASSSSYIAADTYLDTIVATVSY